MMDLKVWKRSMNFYSLWETSILSFTTRVFSERNVSRKFSFVFRKIFREISQNWMKRKCENKAKLFFAKTIVVEDVFCLFAFFRESDWSKISREQRKFSGTNFFFAKRFFLFAVNSIYDTYYQNISIYK